MPSRLALGTVQFGLSYGVTNQTGQVSVDEVARILDAARAAGMDTLDTAMAYGVSEQQLGEIGVRGWRVVTKLGTPPDGMVDVKSWVQTAVAGSLQRLKVDKLAGLLLHKPESLHGTAGGMLYAELMSLKAAGVVEKIGVSVYDPEELDSFAGVHAFDLVQAPFNVFDRRFASSGWLDRLHALQTEVHTRSVLLQGLLLLQPDALPPRFAAWRPLWQRWHAWLDQRGYTPLQACLAFATAQGGIDRVVIGFENAGQLRQAVDATDSTITEFPDELACTDLELISPVRWRKHEKMC